MKVDIAYGNSISFIDTKTVTWAVNKLNNCIFEVKAEAKLNPCGTLLTGINLNIPCSQITEKDTICSGLAKLQCQVTNISTSGVLSVTDDGSGVVIVNNADPQNPIVGFGGVNVDGVTITGDGSIGNPLIATAGSGGLITAIADTNTIDLDVTLGVLTANLKYVDSADFDLSDSGLGFTGELTPTGVIPDTYGDATHVGQFTVDSKGRITSAIEVALLFPTFISSIADTNTIDLAVAGTQLSANLKYVDSADFDLSDSVAGFTGELTTTGVSAGTYGNATNVGQFTVDAKGRLTFAQNVPISVTIAEPNTQVVYGTGASIDSSANFTFDVTTGDLRNNGRFFLTTNGALVYDIITLKNLNSSAPSYIVYQDSAGAERFYTGYRQAQTRMDFISADTVVGLSVDNTGRTLIGMYNSVYIAADTDYILSVDSLTNINATGMVLRRHEGLGGIPIAFKMQDASLVTLVQYGNINMTVVSNAIGAYSGKYDFNIAKLGALVNNMTLDSTSLALKPHGVAAGDTTELRFLELLAAGTEYIGFKAPDAIASSIIWTLPDADAAVSGYVLSSDAAGVLSWIAPTGGGGTVPAGTIGQTLYYASNGTVVTPTSNLFNDGTHITLNAFGGGAGDTAELRFVEPTGLGDHYVGFKAPDNISSSIIWKLPDVDSTGTQSLVSDGAGNLSWASAGVPSLTAMQIAFGDGSNLMTSSSRLTWDNGALELIVDGKLTVTGAIDPTHLYLDEQLGDPTNVAQKGILYTKDVGALTQLFYMDSAGTVKNLSATGVGTVTLVSGTNNRITVATGTTTPVIDIAATYVGQTSITTLGTVTAGTLSTGAIIGGVTMTLGSDAVGDIYYRGGGGVLTRLGAGAANTALLSGLAPSWGKVALTTHVSGVLPIANGGTNKALTLVNGGVVWSDADSFEITAAGSSLQLFQSAGAAAPGWTTLTMPATIAANKMFIATATNVLSETDFREVAEQPLGNLDTWNGTPPSGASTKVYSWFRMGRQINLKIWVIYATPGATNTQVTITLPSDCPTPREPSALGATNDKLYAGAGWMDSSLTGSPPASRAWLKNASSTTYELSIFVASISAIYAHINIWYEAA